MVMLVLFMTTAVGRLGVGGETTQKKMKNQIIDLCGVGFGVNYISSSIRFFVGNFETETDGPSECVYIELERPR